MLDESICYFKSYFVAFILFLMENPVRKQRRPRSDATLYPISQEGSLGDPVGGRVVRWCRVNFQCRGVLQF